VSNKLACELLNQKNKTLKDVFAKTEKFSGKMSLKEGQKLNRKMDVLIDFDFNRFVIPSSHLVVSKSRIVL
jgi:hypothetical protein